ncbi:MAG: DUF1836 domain-containing protein [Eubacteriales bacterium]|nr:DUF1836 domain-containing protein [Eubacteriales bacterium]
MEARKQQFAKRLEDFAPVAWDQIPDLGLYMDQVITFLERQCKSLFSEGERIFTPSMVNNYVKFGLVDRPVGKKYGREQLAQLLMICTLKQAASSDGMKLLLTVPQGESMQQHYERFCRTQREVFAALSASIPTTPPMACAIQGAAYRFLCNAVLVREEEKKDKAHAAPEKQEVEP